MNPLNALGKHESYWSSGACWADASCGSSTWSESQTQKNGVTGVIAFMPWIESYVWHPSSIIYCILLSDYYMSWKKKTVK